MKKRLGSCERKTAETQISIQLWLEGSGCFTGTSGIGFFDHMLELWSKHSGFDLQLECNGDLRVDGHHTVEDVGISLGQAFYEALGDRRGIARYASLALPMDEALVLCALDISGRSGLFWRCGLGNEKIGEFDAALIYEFWRAFVQEARLTLHIQELAGGNSHHMAEAIFKGVARVMKQAVEVVGGDIPSTKGVLA